jgi:hypothetical protein
MTEVSIHVRAALDQKDQVVFLDEAAQPGKEMVGMKAMRRSGPSARSGASSPD